MVKETLWEYRKYHTWSYIPFMIILDVWSIYTGVDYLLQAFNSISSGDFQWFALVGLFWLILGLSHFLMKTKGVLFDQTAIYRITNLGVEFEWGLFEKNREVLPFSEIKKAVLVPYQKGNSTLHFYTDYKMSYRGVDRSRHEIRGHPCFENIRQGHEAIEIIKRKLLESPKSGQLEWEEKDPISNTALISEGQRVRIMWFTSIFVMFYAFCVVDLNSGGGVRRAEVIEAIGQNDRILKSSFITSNQSVLYASGRPYKIGDTLEVVYTPFLDWPYSARGVGGGRDLCGYFQTASLKFGLFGIVALYFLIVFATLAVTPVVNDPMIRSFVSEGVLAMIIFMLIILEFA